MRFFLPLFFHNQSKDRSENGLVYIPPDRNDWPETWRSIKYKRYSFFKNILLPRVNGSFFDNYLSRRKSALETSVGHSFTLDDLSYTLQCGYGLQHAPEESRLNHRTVPSAGQQYPLELYVFVFRNIPGLAPGLYHYGIQRHLLEPVNLSSFKTDQILSISPTEEIKRAQGMIVMTGVFERTIGKYGSRGYRYMLLEAGHAAQNILLAGTERNHALLPLGGVNDEAIEKYIGLVPDHESVLYSILF